MQKNYVTHVEYAEELRRTCWLCRRTMPYTKEYAVEFIVGKMCKRTILPTKYLRESSILKICRSITRFTRNARRLCVYRLCDYPRIHRIATFFTGYAELLRSSQDMQNCYILHRICKIVTFFNDMKNCYVLHRINRIALFFTGNAELLHSS
jgi:hypothetical protein